MAHAGDAAASSPVPPAERVPIPPDPGGGGVACSRKSFSTTDGSSFMVLDSAEEGGSVRFGGGGRRTLAREPGEENLWRSRRARSAAGLWVQACLGFARSSRPLGVSLFTPSVRPPEPWCLKQQSSRLPRSSLGRLSASRRAAWNKAPGGARRPRPLPPPALGCRPGSRRRPLS